MSDEKLKLNIGAGRIRKTGFKNIDIAQYVDGTGKALVYYVLNIEKQPLPFADNTVNEIVADNVLEHLYELIFPMNEMHRVLKIGGTLKGVVPVAGTKESYMDPTHRRFFIKATFDYFCGENLAIPNRPYHPRYADYGILPWNKISLEQKENLIYFELTPRK